MSGSDQQNLMEVTGRSAESLEIMARALRVKNAELQPTLEAIASTAVTNERVTTLLATFAALALAEAQRAGQLHDALGNRDVIGQAKGILMERHGITADAAFSVLSRVSQAENIKLAEVARRLVETGGLPSVAGQEAAGATP